MKNDRIANGLTAMVSRGFCFVAVLGLSLAPMICDSAVWQTVVDGSSFSSTTAFQANWDYNYPWGTDHNGSARMNATNTVVSGGMVTMTSSLTNVYEGTSSESPYLTIRYNSGTFYLKQQITVDSEFPIWDISGQFKVPTQTGTWPAFWMTGANSWPPESDFAEFKGSDGCNQNTYDGSWQTSTTPVSTANTAWHTYRMVACLENSTNVDFHYYIDGVMKSEQTAYTFVGSPCWLIVDYQMEGSSGTPGPSATTFYYASNIVVKRLVTSGNGPIAGGAYKMIASNSGESLDVGNQDTANDSTLDQWPYNAGLNEQWIATYLGNNTYSFIGRQSGRALQVTNSQTVNGAGIELMDYTNGNNQQWMVSPTSGGYYTLMNVNSGKMMEVADNSSANFAQVNQWSSGGSTYPLISNATPSAAGLIMNGSTGIPGNNYSWLTSTNILTPFSNWVSSASVVFDTNGNFTSTQALAPGSLQQFFALQMQGTNGAANQQWSFQSP
jgi:hypothetical protein